MKHLIIIQNGLNGWSYAMGSIKKFLEEELDENYIVYVSDVNDFTKTWNGIEQCGINLAKFVYDCCEKHNVNFISFIGHSLGGLIIRYCIGILEKHKFFDKIRPVLYTSVSTPHLGIFSLNNLGQTVANYIIGKTGKELLVKDKDKLLIEMSKPGTYYYDGLSKFESLVAYGNIKNDHMVSFESSCMTYPLKNPDKFKLGELTVIDSMKDCKYVKNYYEEEIRIYENLSYLPWIRKGINISNYFNVHNAIINKGLTKQTKVLKDIVNSLHPSVI